MERLSEREAMDLLLYYAREGLHRHMQDAAQRQLEQLGEHAVFRFWRGVALALQGAHTEAARDYAQCSGGRDVVIAVIAAQIHSLRSQRQVDQDAADELETKMMMEEKAAGPSAWLQLAALQWLLGDHIRARDAAQRAAGDGTDSFLSQQALLGWINLTSGRSAFVEKSIANFERAVDPQSGGSATHVDAQLGKVAFLTLRRNHSAAVHTLNTVIAALSASSELAGPVHIEKAKVLFKKGQPDQAAEAVQRLLKHNPHDVEALMLLVLYLMVEDAKQWSTTASSMRELYKALEMTEPRSHKLFAYVSKSLARVALNPGLLVHTMALINKACELQPKNAEYLSEKAYQLSLAGEWSKSLEAYRAVQQVDDGNIGALHGVVRTQLMLGKLDDAEQQLEFLNQMQISERPAELCYQTAVMKWKKHKDQDGSLEALDEAVAVHSKNANGVPSYEFYEQFNPQLLLAIVREYLQHCPTEPVSATDPPSTAAAKARKPLELLLKHVKGSLEAQLLMARLDFVQNDLENAQHAINACIRADPTYAEAHLLAAQIAFFQESFQQTQQALDQCAMEFEAREWPQYNLLKGRVANATGKYDEALKDLETAVALTQQPAQGRRYRPLNVQDHVAIYLELAQVHLRRKGTEAAEATIIQALNLFRGTHEEGRVVVAQAMVVCKKDVERGLAMLRSVSQDSPYFLKAKAHMANIYLNIRNNKRAFAKCYEELAEAFPTAASYLFLGEAYMSIQEPEKAIQAFERARELDPSDAEMASRIGLAFITTHDYAKAIQYYKNAVKAEPQKLSLRHDLASLYWKLGSFDEAERELKNCLQKKEKTKLSEDVQTISDDVKTTLLLAKVFKSAGDSKKVGEMLIQARVFQNTVLSKIKGENPEYVQRQKTIGANICTELGEIYRKQKQVDKAVASHNEALRLDETHVTSMLALAKLYRDKGELEGCEQQASALLRIDPGNEEASMTLADLMFRKCKYEEATYHFQQLLERKPGNYDALVQFVQLLRRAGRLFEAPRFFTSAEQNARRSEPGLHFAKGLYYRYTNNPRAALKEFHRGRQAKGSKWSELSTVHMVEIYLNPDQESSWEEAEEEERADQTENIQWAQKLLPEIKDKEKRRLLEAYVKVARRRKEDLEAALTQFHDIMVGGGEGGADQLNTENINVPCIVGMATALQIMKVTQKARNHLKRVAKVPYNQDEAEDFERAWLLLADIHIAGGKYDLAQDLLQKCLEMNKSCCRAWEYMGVIYEKEQSYRDAADCYENAWRLVKESNPTIGYKLAFNYLKAKKYVNAIDVTQKVLESHPKYPKIRKDILEKARASLRP